MDRPSEVRCDYVRWKAEKLTSITWSVCYPGVKTDILKYTQYGGKLTPSTTFIEADADTATENKVDLRVLAGSDPEEEVKICCEVAVLFDDGYGGMKSLTNERCSDFKVVKGVQRPVEVDIWSSHQQAEVIKEKESHSSFIL